MRIEFRALRFGWLAGLFLTGLAAASQESPSSPPREEEIEHLRVMTANTLSAGEFELNLVGEVLRFNSGLREGWAGTVRAELEVGLTDRLMAEVELNYLFLRPEHGRDVNRTGDIEVEAKYRFFDIGGLSVAAGLSAGSVVELEEDGEIERLPSAEVFVPVSWAILPFLEVHLAAGVEAVHGESPERFVQAAVEWRPFGEILALQMGFSSEAEGGRAPDTVLGPGILVSLGEPEIRFGLGVLAGVSESAEDWAILLNVEIELE